MCWFHYTPNQYLCQLFILYYTSILKALKKFKELVANMPKKEHEKKKEKTR